MYGLGGAVSVRCSGGVAFSRASAWGPVALDAYVQRDVKLAEEVIHRDREVDQMYSGQFREFLTYMMEDPRNITPCMHLHFIAKNIERMGDHVTSIAEQVIYIVTGDRPTEEREKKDKTSADVNVSLDLE